MIFMCKCLIAQYDVSSTYPFQQHSTFSLVHLPVANLSIFLFPFWAVESAASWLEESLPATVTLPFPP